MSVDAIIEKINDVLKSYKAEYSCKKVSWDDVSRFGAGTSSVSCFGSNITDTRLFAKDNTMLFVVRPNNWNEKIAKVRAEDIAIVDRQRNPINFRNFLENIGEYGKYVIDDTSLNLFDNNLDNEVSVRFQTTFIPCKEKLDVAPEVYNYQGTDTNLLVLGTSLGVSLSLNEKGRNKLFQHFDNSNHWFEIEKTNYKVGGSQNESNEDTLKNIKKEKGISARIGIPAMGTRMNVLMTAQIPLNKPRKSSFYSGKIVKCNNEESYTPPGGFSDSVNKNSTKYNCIKGSRGGVSSVGRINKGSNDRSSFKTIDSKKLVRAQDEHITITIVIYNVIESDVPSEEDIKAAIDDMEELYKSCKWSGNITKAEFMKSIPLNNFEESKRTEFPVY